MLFLEHIDFRPVHLLFVMGYVYTTRKGTFNGNFSLFKTNTFYSRENC